MSSLYTQCDSTSIISIWGEKLKIINTLMIRAYKIPKFLKLEDQAGDLHRGFSSQDELEHRWKTVLQHINSYHEMVAEGNVYSTLWISSYNWEVLPTMKED